MRRLWQGRRASVTRVSSSGSGTVAVERVSAAAWAVVGSEGGSTIGALTTSERRRWLDEGFTKLVEAAGLEQGGMPGMGSGWGAIHRTDARTFVRRLARGYRQGRECARDVSARIGIARVVLERKNERRWGSTRR